MSLTHHVKCVRDSTPVSVLCGTGRERCFLPGCGARCEDCLLPRVTKDEMIISYLLLLSVLERGIRIANHCRERVGQPNEPPLSRVLIVGVRVRGVSPTRGGCGRG